MIEKRHGIALVLIAGILVLMAGFSVAMLGLAGRLRIETSAGTDHAAARLLARSGIEYAAARLGNDASRPDSPTPGNQPDDWACRDERDVPVEKALNPSYAQTEPYADAPTGNGRYDPGADFFTDVNSNGRFDSWSGRLRGRYGMASGTFHLKIGGTGGSQGGSGGINVNSGLMDDTDANGNNVPDYRDLEKFWGGANEGRYSPINPFSRNVRIAFALNQLGLILGIAPSPVELARAALATPLVPAVAPPPPNGAAGFAAQAADTPPPPLATGVGDIIVAHRPAGGYRDLDEMAKLFLPADWSRLRDHLTARSRRNPSAVYRSYGVGRPLFPAVLYEPDIGYVVEAAAASRETLAALFAGMGESFITYPQSHLNDRCEITPAEALRAADFLKQRPFTSWYELFGALQRGKGALFVPVSTDPFSESQNFTKLDAVSPGFTQTLKAGWAHALAMPDEAGLSLAIQAPWFDFNGWDPATYGAPRNPTITSPTGDRLADAGQYYLRSPKSIDGNIRLLIEDRWRTTSGPAFALGFGPAPSWFGVESLGRVDDARGNPRSLRKAAASILNEGTVSARTQYDFENSRFDRETRILSASCRFDGGTIAGRPRRDRTGTYPFYSLDACPGLRNHPLLAQRGTYPIFVLSGLPYRERGFPCDYNYCRYGGEVMLSPRSWLDSDPANGCVFYRPCWDLEQPERPTPARASLGDGESNFDDVAGGAKWRRSGRYFNGADIFGSSLLYGDALYVAYSGPSGGLTSRATPTLCPATGRNGAWFQWDPGKAEADNPVDFPLLSKAGTVDRGTFEGWYTVYNVYNAGASGNETICQANPMHVTATFSTWSQSWMQGSQLESNGWSDAGQAADTVEARHVVFAFGGPDRRVEAYVNGVWRGGTDYDVLPSDSGAGQSLAAFSGTSQSFLPNELRMYARPLSQAETRVHALKGRFWTADPGAPVPSFTSAKYAFDGPVELTRIAWDGFVPGVLRDAVDTAHGSGAVGSRTPIRVDLLLYLRSESQPIRIELPRESWRTGGCQADFKALWRAAHPDPADPLPRISALQYQVWMDASALDRAWKSPVFDGIEMGYKGRGGYSGLEER